MSAKVPLRTIEDDKARLKGALYRDVGVEVECPARSFLMRAITNERIRGLLPNDTFDTMVHSAATPRGREVLLGIFGVPHLEQA